MKKLILFVKTQFHNSFNRHLLSTYPMLYPVLRTQERTIKKTNYIGFLLLSNNYYKFSSQEQQTFLLSLSFSGPRVWALLNWVFCFTTGPAAVNMLAGPHSHPKAQVDSSSAPKHTPVVGRIHCLVVTGLSASGFQLAVKWGPQFPDATSDSTQTSACFFKTSRRRVDLWAQRAPNPRDTDSSQSIAC